MSENSHRIHGTALDLLTPARVNSSKRAGEGAPAKHQAAITGSQMAHPGPCYFGRPVKP